MRRGNQPKLDTGRATTDNNHVEEAVDLLRTLAKEAGGLDAYRGVLGI